MRLNLLILCAGTISLSLFFGCNDKRLDKKPGGTNLPNFVLLMGDDHGWDEVGYNGHPFVKTPVLDEMASMGMRFDRFYSGHPSCSPTRASFLTGRHPNRYGTFSPNWSIRPQEISIAHMLKKAGYRSAHFGKWHVGPVKSTSPISPGAMGFDEWLSHDNFFELDPVLSKNGNEPQKIDGESSKVIIDAAIRFMEQAQADQQPFMVVVWFGSPHEPYSALPEDLAFYDNLPDTLNQDTVRLTSNETGRSTRRPLGAVLQERYAEITAMDRAIGDLRNHLVQNDLRDNTLLLYCGDNGTPSSAGRTGMTIRKDKGSLYEGGILVPGVIEWPAVISKPAVNINMAVTSDILPTIADITKQPIPDRPLDGESLLPYLLQPQKERTEPIFFWKFNIENAFSDSPKPYIDPALQEGTTPLAKMMAGKYTRTFRNYVYSEASANDLVGERAMVTNKFKLVLEGDVSDGYELYDLENDRAEQVNVAAKYPELVKQMRGEMKSWQESVLQSLTGADY
ncbi:MAG: sulfatase-like hydrolase/transferase [Saprospiraceae bacterium]|nr:sulfatase-like hydrolase/transferase [Saprospiraceae bacterium]